MIQTLLNQLQLKYSECNIYLYGSHVYSTNSQKSDYDFIIVGNITTDDSIKTEFGDLHFYSKQDFSNLLYNQEISALECFFLPEAFKRERFPLEWTLDLSRLRSSLSQKSSNSWVKAQKKLTVENEPYIAQKSLFHSLRIIKFGIQIAATGKLSDFDSRVLWSEICSLPEDWETWKSHFKTQYNSLKSEFKKIAPKT